MIRLPLTTELSLTLSLLDSSRMKLLILFSIVYSFQPIFGYVDLRLNNDKTMLYLYSNESRIWSEMDSYCSSLNGTMGVVESNEISNIVTSMFEYDAVWIAAIETVAGSKMYKWSNGSAIHYSNWDEGQPDLLPDSKGHLLCICLMGTGKWLDYPCSYTSRTLCQFHVKNMSVPYFIHAIGSDTTPVASGILFGLSHSTDSILERLDEVGSSVDILKENFTELRRISDNDFVTYLRDSNSTIERINITDYRLDTLNETFWHMNQDFKSLDISYRIILSILVFFFILFTLLIVFQFYFFRAFRRSNDMQDQLLLAGLNISVTDSGEENQYVSNNK